MDLSEENLGSSNAAAELISRRTRNAGPSDKVGMGIRECMTTDLTLRVRERAPTIRRHFNQVDEAAIREKKGISTRNERRKEAEGVGW